MVSTRGIKVKFSEGERVLCYEPDPTKAKVLYDSKVLQVVHNKDAKGKKVIEYLIHFQGWNATWDRRVTEDFVLKDTDESRELQKELAEKAHIKLSIKSNRVLTGPGSFSNHKKRKRRLSETIRETIERERKNKSESDNSSKSGTTDDEMTSLSSEVGSSTVSNEDTDTEKEIEEETEENLTDEETIAKDIPLSFPESLKNILTKDHQEINDKNRLVKLPSDKTVLSILEDYVKLFAMRYLARNSEKRKTEFKEKDKAYMTLDLCKEFVDGIRICFDFYLETLLLYAKERNQAERLIKAAALKTEKKPDNTYQKNLPSKERPEEVKETRSHSKVEKAATQTITRRVLRSQKPSPEESAQTNFSLSSSGATGNTSNSSVSEGKEASSLRSQHQTQSQSCESGRSTPSTLTSGTSAVDTFFFNGESLPLHLDSFAQDFNTWTLLPTAYRTPTPPVLIYGLVHLLRLFVKLPEILYKMNISPERKKILLHHMDMFLEYLNLHSQPSEIQYVNNDI